MTPLKKIAVLIADDHPVVRRSLRALLVADGQFAVVGEARNGREAVAMARRLRPDVTLMDISMPVLNGLEATRQILAATPSAKVIILSALNDDEYLECAEAIGVSGYLEKQTVAGTLGQAVRAVANGRSFFSPAIARRLPHHSGRPRSRVGAPPTSGVRRPSSRSAILPPETERGGIEAVAARVRLSLKTVKRRLRQPIAKLKTARAADLSHLALTARTIKSSVRLVII